MCHIHFDGKEPPNSSTCKLCSQVQSMAASSLAITDIKVLYWTASL